MSARPRKRGRRGGGGQGGEQPPQPSVTRTDLEPKTVAELKAMATELGLDIKVLKKIASSQSDGEETKGDDDV